MKLHKSLLCASLLCAATWVVAQAPTIKSASPRRFVVERNNTFHSIELSGANLARRDTTGFTFDKDVQVFVRSSAGGDFQKARITSWRTDQLTVSLEAANWMMNPQTLYFKVSVRDMGESKQFALPVDPLPTAPPRLKSVSNSVLPVLSAIKRDQDRIIRVVAENLTNQSAVSVGGRGCSIAWANFGDGVIDCWIAKEAQGIPGVYEVQVSDPSGSSNSMKLTVLAPPSIQRVTPAGLGVTSVATPVRVDYASGEDPTVLLRAVSGEWKPVNSSKGPDGALTVSIPPEFLSKPQTVEMKLTNRVGESPISRIPVDLKALQMRTVAVQGINSRIAQPATQVQKPVMVKPAPPR